AGHVVLRVLEETSWVSQAGQVVEGWPPSVEPDIHAATRALISSAARSRYRSATAGHINSGAVTAAAWLMPTPSSCLVSRVRSASAMAAGSPWGTSSPAPSLS